MRKETHNIIERIRRMMEMTGRPMDAGQIIQETLAMRSPDNAAADRILEGILRGDARFEHREGMWFLLEARRSYPDTFANKAGFLCIQHTRDSNGRLQLRGALYVPGKEPPFSFTSGYASAPGGPSRFRELRCTTEDYPLVAWNINEIRCWNRLLDKLGVERWLENPICLGELASLVLRKPILELAPENLASYLSIVPPASDAPGAVARFMAEAFLCLLARLPLEARTDPAALQSWIQVATPRIDFSRFAFRRRFLNGLSENSGVYIMRDRAGRIIYVGKSRNLKRRIRSYFTPRASENSKVARIHDHLYSIEICETPNEVEALLLEIHMIQDFHPPINFQVEIHDRQETRNRQRSLILMTPEHGSDEVAIYFIREGHFVGQTSGKLGVPLSKRLESRIRSIYFRSRMKRLRRQEPWKTELLTRWLASNRRRINWLDVDQAGNLPTVLRQLGSYMNDPDKLAHKVFYR